MNDPGYVNMVDSHDDLRPILSEKEVRTKYPHLGVLGGLTSFLDGTGKGPMGWLGADFIIGFVVPVGGDTITLVLSFGIVGAAIYHRAPAPVVRKMLKNLTVDFGVGMIPGLGDYWDFTLKPNRMNYALLIMHVRETGGRGAAG